MQITITNTAQSTWIVIALLLGVLLLTLRTSTHREIFPVAVSQELKGLAILSIVFAHISYMLVNDSRFLYPLSMAAGVGVDVFLFMSGFGLTTGMLKKPVSALEFYRRRLIKVFIPFWLVLLGVLIADFVVHGTRYSAPYLLQSMLGWFPSAHGFKDVNSPLWYISWLLMFYVLFPLLFWPQRPWFTALLLAVIANAFTMFDPLDLQVNWLHRLHTYAFSFGMLMAWWLQTHAEKKQRLEAWCAQAPWSMRATLITPALLMAGYMALNNSYTSWPALSSLLGKVNLDSGVVIGQATSLLSMAALLLVFVVKRWDSGVLHLFGVYSYETYLLHWPLMSRYDVFFHYLPAWAATVLWLCAFIAAGWLLQTVTTPITACVDRRERSTRSG